MTLLPLDLTFPVPLSQSPVWVNALPCRVAAGFPSPADDHMVQRVDLMARLIKHPQATFLLRVRGESMRDAGILAASVSNADWLPAKRAAACGMPRRQLNHRSQDIK